MNKYTTAGLVLREEPWKEKNRYINILTPGEGLVRATAYGACRMGSPLCAATGLFVYAEFTLTEQRGHIKVESARVIEQFFGLSQSMEALAAASYMTELLRDAAVAGVADEGLLRLALHTFHALANKGKNPALCKAAFELRLMMQIGYAPSLDACALCGEESPRAMYFSVEEGCVVCDGCANGPSQVLLPITPGALAAMHHIAQAPLSRLFSFSVGEDSMRTLCAVCEEYAAVQMDRRYKSLDIYRALCAY